MRLEMLPLKEKRHKSHRKRKKKLHPKAPDLQKGLMSLTCFQRPLRRFWLTEFLTPSSLQAEAKSVRQVGEGRENAKGKNPSLPKHMSKQAGKKPSAYGGNSSHFYLKYLWRKHRKCSMGSHSLGVFMTHCKIALSI